MTHRLRLQQTRTSSHSPDIELQFCYSQLWARVYSADSAIGTIVVYDTNLHAVEKFANFRQVLSLAYRERCLASRSLLLGLRNAAIYILDSMGFGT